MVRVLSLFSPLGVMVSKLSLIRSEARVGSVHRRVQHVGA
jgi:hypothetical protein